MEVTRDNFEQVADEIKSLLPTAEFYAIDEEMTGIMLDKSTAPHMGDTVELRYEKMRRVTQEFNLMQVGICLYHRHSEEGEAAGLVARPYNFFVLPDAKSSCGKLRMHISTAEFHNSNGMDYNKWLRKGVPFLSQAELDAQIGAIEDTLADGPRPDHQRVQLTREADKAFVAATLQGITEWVAVGDGGEHVLPECNAFLRRALYEAVGADHPDLAIESRVVDPDMPHKKRLVVLQLSDEERAARRAEKRRLKVEALRARAGFLRVFEMLVASRKPLVGHNLTYDLMFLYSHLHAPLPPTLAEYKAGCHELFPLVWDTKLCSVASGVFNDTMLASLHASCVSSDGVPAVRLADGFTAYASGERCHEAGYDAYITGVAHSALQHLGHAPATRLNLCYLMRSLSILNLGGDDALMETGTCLHLTFDLTSRTTAELVDLFAPLLAPSADSSSAADAATVDAASTSAHSAAPASASVRWISETSAFVVLPAVCGHVSLEDVALHSMERPEWKGLCVQSFEDWRAAQAKAIATSEPFRLDATSQQAKEADGEPTMTEAQWRAKAAAEAQEAAGVVAGKAAEAEVSRRTARPLAKAKRTRTPTVANPDDEPPRRSLRSTTKTHA